MKTDTQLVKKVLLKSCLNVMTLREAAIVIKDLPIDRDDFDEDMDSLDILWTFTEDVSK